MNRPISKRILIVEDDAEMRNMFELLLTGEGYVVVQCKSGERALALHAEEPFDLVIIELLLAGHDGFDTLVKLRRTGRPPKVIVTAKSSWTAAEVYFKMAKQLGADKTLAKPFTAEQFLETARKLLGKES
ncbi:MAG TPA: response regulator [Verrucomicrobiae bacterium]|jgi:DNA-binding response OmpR family regulator